MAEPATQFVCEFARCCCATCGIVYFVPDNWQRMRREKRDTFYCPNGHGQSYNGPTQAERERDEAQRALKQAEESRQWYQRKLDAEQRSHSATKGKLTKTLNRIHADVCPHCQRTFTNIARHMASKHSEVADD